MQRLPLSALRAFAAVYQQLEPDRSLEHEVPVAGKFRKVLPNRAADAVDRCSSFLTLMEPGCRTRCEYQGCCGTRLEPQRPIDPLRAVEICRLYCDESTEDGGREPASAPGNERSHESTREGAQRCEHGREDQHRRFALPHTTSLLRGRLLSTPGATGASTTVRPNECVLRQVVSCWLSPLAR